MVHLVHCNTANGRFRCIPNTAQFVSLNVLKKIFFLTTHILSISSQIKKKFIPFVFIVEVSGFSFSNSVGFF